MNASSTSRDRTFRNWIPTASLSGLRQEVTDLVESFLHETVPQFRGEQLPHVDVVECGEIIEVIADVPGFCESEITVELVDDHLVLAGQHPIVTAEDQPKESVPEKHFHQVERRLTTFQRSISLPCPVDEAHLEASLRNGVLTVRLPKRTETRRRTVPIRVVEVPTPIVASGESTF